MIKLFKFVRQPEGSETHICVITGAVSNIFLGEPYATYEGIHTFGIIEEKYLIKHPIRKAETVLLRSVSKFTPSSNFSKYSLWMFPKLLMLWLARLRIKIIYVFIYLRRYLRSRTQSTWISRTENRYFHLLYYWIHQLNSLTMQFIS